ncbi:hypothetical protein BDM02DRAFT_3191297 [Thelephora ganbajun]|uniref:Uncharacterized protein n=1 Tax=Thelephora ganbajun TaxID=370292 RepID=A0ACB6Z3J4_THEGA|nr:hypothetical protein BDM02DRAFT_3191297 [Thelephora ganbajun]
MATVSLLANPLANTSSSSFSEPPQIISNPSNPSSDQPQPSTSQPDGNQSVTEVIIEALRSKDRLFVLKLGEQMEALINERKTRIDLNPTTSYQRLLVHRCSAYYRLAPENDPTSKGITVYPTADSKIPPRRIAELVPLEETAQPAFKIMRRVQQDRTKLKPASQAGSIAGEDADLSDLDPFETGSQGGRSNATGNNSHHKKYMTIEEREAAYNEARSRIFMDFEEKEKVKEKVKEKDMSANSFTFSQVSGSASTSAGRDSGSVGDIEDSLSSVATESEWSGPVTRNEKPRRSGSGNTSAGSSRSLRSFNNGGSSHNSRATSPSFSYASLYEPPPASYDQPQYIGHPPIGYNHAYMYTPYPPPSGQPMGQGAVPQYPYYQPYPYHPQHPHSDPTSPSMGEPMFHPQPHPHSQSQQQLPYPPQYMWPPGHHPPPPQPPQHTQSAPPQPVHPSSTPNVAPPQGSGYPQQFIPPSGQYGHYPMPYYPPHPQGPPSTQPSHPMPHIHSQLYHPDNNGQGHRPVIGNQNPSVDSHNGRRGGGHNNRRNAPKVRTTWSYGPGPGGFQYHNNNGDTVGPRLTPSRRTSGNSSAGSRTPGDEASSTASSSTTSSSSRHTYTSTSTTSKHPLPARPDWAVGLKAQPTLSPRGHHDQHQNSPCGLPAIVKYAIKFGKTDPRCEWCVEQSDIKQIDHDARLFRTWDAWVGISALS